MENMNDRVEQWANRNSKMLKIVYCIWSFVLVLVVLLFAFGFLDDISFDADQVPVGFMDNVLFEFIDSCTNHGGTYNIQTKLCTLANGWAIYFVDWDLDSDDWIWDQLLENGND